MIAVISLNNFKNASCDHVYNVLKYSIITVDKISHNCRLHFVRIRR
jgi:hypothetical protein